MKLSKNTLIIFILFFSFNNYAQKQVSELVKTEFLVNKNIQQFESILKRDINFKNSAEIKDAIFFDLDKSLVDEIIENKYQAITIKMQLFDDIYYNIDLISSNRNFEDLTIETSGNQKIDLEKSKSTHYMGVIRGFEKSSLIALSFFENEIAGFISNEQGNFTIGKLKDLDKQIFYNDKNIKLERKSCADISVNPDNEINNKIGIPPIEAIPLERCVKFSYYTEFDIYQGFNNNLNNVYNYVTALHNQVAIIFLNEQINTPLNYIYIFTTPDPYNDSIAVNTLNSFKNDYQSFNGNCAHLLTFRNFSDAGGIAFLNNTNSMCGKQYEVSTIANTFENVPIYSWSVYVLSHEFGHSLGSKHTQACAWNGNNTAIDSCTTLEGSCANPGLPPSGGTIMSYCHNSSVGINFANGFGTQPGYRIRSVINSSLSATCLASCCATNLNLTVDVLGNASENQQCSNTILATNKINNSSSVIYHAGNEVVLSNGFAAYQGSFFKAYKEGCSNVYNNSRTNEDYSNNVILKQKSEINCKLLPNPNNGLFKIVFEDEFEEVDISVDDLYGNNCHNSSYKNLKEFEINILNKPNGIYIVKITSKIKNTILKFIKQ